MHRQRFSWPGIVERALVWAGLAAILNGAGELAQFPLHLYATDPDRVRAAAGLLHSILGDALVATALYFVVAAALRNLDWLRHRARLGAALLTALGVTYAAASEWYNVYRLGDLPYTEAMPVVAGIGVMPLVQWLVVPPLMVLLMRELE